MKEEAYAWKQARKGDKSEGEREKEKWRVGGGIETTLLAAKASKRQTE